MDKIRSYQLGIYEKAMPSHLSLPQKLTLARDAGFDYVELSVDEKDEKLDRLDWSKKERKALLDQMWEANMFLGSLCLSGQRRFPMGSHDPLLEKRSVEILHKAIDLASDLSIPLIQLAGYDVYYEESDEGSQARFEKHLKEASLYAAERGILLGFETMETPFMDTVEKAMKYVNRVNLPYLGVYPDIGNLTNAAKIYGKPVIEDLQLGAGHLFACHLKETLPGKYRELPFGSGHTRYVEDIQVLKMLGVRRFVGEFWDLGQENYREIIFHSEAFLRDKLDQVFL